MVTHKFLRLLLLLFGFLFIQPAKAQNRQVKNIWGYVREIIYGKELKDIDGNTIRRKDTAYFLYLETKTANPPVITAASYRGSSFSAAVYPVDEPVAEVGVDSRSGQKVRIKKEGASTSLWKIELIPTVIAEKTTSGKMTLKGTINTQPFSLTIKKMVVLEPEISG